MKKTFTTTIVLVFITANLFGQYLPKNPPPKSYFHGDWSVGLAIKSSFENITTYRALQENYEFNYDPKFSYEIELFIEKKLWNNWVWVMGVNYHGLSFEYDYKIPIQYNNTSTTNSDGGIINTFDMELDNSFERIEMTAIAEFYNFEDGNDYENEEMLDFRIRSVNRIVYLGIPLGIKKEFGFQKLKFTSKIGMEPAYIIKSEIDYQHYHQSGMYIEGARENYKFRGEESERVKLTELTIHSQTDYLKKFQLNGIVNIGFVHTYKYHTFFMEAEYKRSLTAFSKKNKSSYLQSLGFRTGFIQRFRGNEVIDLSKRRPKFNW